MATEREKQGTIHDLEAQLAAISEYDNSVPANKAAINHYIKEFNKLGLFPKGATKAKKEAIIKKIIVANFNEGDVTEQQQILDSTIKYNRLIDRIRKKLQDEASRGKNMKKNEDYLRMREKYEVNIPRKIREDLHIHDKAVRLFKYDPTPTRNRIKYFSGQDYGFLIRDGFNKPYIIPYKKLQEIRKKGNVVEFLLKKYEEGIDLAYQKDKKKYFKDKKKWAAKQKVYKKLYKIVGHNLQIATNEKYHKKLIQRDTEGNIKKDNSEYPVFMKILDETIELFIP